MITINNLQKHFGSKTAIDIEHYDIAPGDTVSVVRRLPDRALVKKNGVTGWYFGRLGEKR